MLFRILLGACCFLASLSLAPQPVEARNYTGDRLQRACQPTAQHSRGHRLREHRSISQRSVGQRSINHRSINHRSINHRSIWSQGGCSTSPRRVHVQLPRCQTHYFCVDGVRKRRLPCGVVERWKPAHFKYVTKKVRVSGGCRNEIRYRVRYICGTSVKVPYTIQVALPDRWELRRERVHVQGCWIPEKGRQCRLQKCCNTKRVRY